MYNEKKKHYDSFSKWEGFLEKKNIKESLLGANFWWSRGKIPRDYLLMTCQQKILAVITTSQFPSQ